MLTLFAQEIRQIPFIRIVVPFILGLIVELYIPASANFLTPVFAFFIVLLVVIFVFFSKNTYKRRLWNGLLLYLAVFTFALIRAETASVSIPEILNQKVIVKATLIEPLTVKANSEKTVLESKYITTKNKTVHQSYKILTYFEKDSTIKLTYGDQILFTTTLSELKNPGNPDEFDYAGYLRNKGITAQCYIEAENFERIDSAQGNKLIAFALQTRQKLSGIYKRNHIAGDELAVLSALTLGDKSELEPETKTAYVNAGAMHILAVSGLHVGIIYVIISYILKFLKKFKIGRYKVGIVISALLTLLVLWFFAFLTGFSPSVQRAAVMFSFITVGDALQRRVNIYNSLAASAFVLLVYNPRLILAVGFQLSYIAVLSIVYIQPRLEQLLTFKFLPLQKIWVLTTVSIAAQIGTLPISLMYFHVFPNWFALSNLIVIPLATIIVYTAGLMLVVSGISFLSEGIGYVLKFVVKLLNLAVDSINNLPYSATKNIAFELTDTLFLYVIIIGILIFFQYKQRKHLFYTFGLIVIYFAFLVNHELIQYKQHKMLVYNVRKSSLIQFVHNNKILNFGDSLLMSDNRYDYAVGNHLNNMGIRTSDFYRLDSAKSIHNELLFKKNEYILYGDKKIALLSKKEQSLFISDTSVHLDCVILSGNEYFFIADIQNLYRPDIIVFDSSNKLNRIERWKEECDTLNQAFHSVPEQGAFVLDCR
ncbi:MAG: ComEC/Rec2 family competence protein [Bacteroidota bacterium]|nr:ComEC/Rec2 family competence protein [Bacteroidota bacterium]